MKERDLLCKHINNIINNNISNSLQQKSWVLKLNETFDIPSNISSDILTLRIGIEEQTDYILFCVAYILDNKLVSKHFVDKEINSYIETKYKIEKFKLPIKWKMIQISDNQWIGKITVKDLMKLRNAQLIKYNENAQRTLKRIIRGGTEVFSIALNKTAVKEIMDSYSNDLYIPNTITLNLPEESDYDYDGENLIIKDFDGFDILDGYHRYIAMSNLYNLNKNFDYVMELRVVVFEEERARQFIFQEDQKTKMSKVDSDSFNQNNPANQIAQALNSKGILTGLISRNKGIIDSTLFSSMVGQVFFYGVPKRDIKKKTIETRELLYKRMNEMIDECPELIEKKWDREFIAWTVLLSSYNIDGSEIISIINKVKSKMTKEMYGSLYKGKVASPILINRMKKVYEQEV